MLDQLSTAHKDSHVQEVLMERWLGTYAPYLYALMRIVLGVLFACHGAQKLFGILKGQDRAATIVQGCDLGTKGRIDR